MTPIRRLALVAATVFAIGAGPLVAHADDDDDRRGHKHGPWCRHEHSSRYDNRYDRRATYNPEKCADIERRISKAHYEIRKNEGTGRHRDALRWFKNDLRVASREHAAYCNGRSASRWDRRDYDRNRYDRDRWWYDNSGYDVDERYDDRRYDPYYEDSDGFDIKRDWPAILGVFMGGGLGAGY